MSSSYSIEISGNERPASAHSKSIDSAGEESDFSSPEPSSSNQNRWGQGQTADHAASRAASGTRSPAPVAYGLSSRLVDSRNSSLRESGRLSQQLQQKVQQQHLEHLGDVEPRNSFKGDEASSVLQSADRGTAFGHEDSTSSLRGSQQRPPQPQKQWGHGVSLRSQSGSLSGPLDGAPGASAPQASPDGASSLKGSASAVTPRRVASGHPFEGILKRRSDKWTKESTIADYCIVSPGHRLWLAQGSVLWRLFCFALGARVGTALLLLVMVLTTLGRMGRAVTCVDMSNCVGGGGILAFPVLLRTLPNFGAGIVAYEAITESLVAGLVLMLLPMAGNCYYTCQALVKGTKKAFLDEMRATTWCTAWLGACLGAFLPPAFITEQFCDPANFDVNVAYRASATSVEAASRNMCDQAGLSRACVAVGVLCVCSSAVLLFQRYSRLWAALLGLGCLKFMFSGFILCFTIMFGGQANEMMLEAIDGHGLNPMEEGLQRPMMTQLGLFFALLKWGGFILAFSNLACGAFTVWAAHLRSHLLSCVNLVANFVFFFINAVAFFAMLFESATLRMVCNYRDYPMDQSQRALAEAAFFCTIRPQFLFVWFLVALLALIHLIEFLVSAVLFQREFCSLAAKSPALMSAPSIDSLPPKWGTKR
ncbi:hypothetical protein ACSSS7_003301 [Eimeria intestinalis]